jgi:hypothetical protein
MRIQTTDGFVFEGEDAKEIVRKMRDTQWGAPVIKRDYMEEVKDRISGAPGSTEIVADQGADAFLASLVSNNLIRFVPDGEVITDDLDADNQPAFADDADVDAEHAYDPDVDDDEPHFESDPRD